MDLRLDQNLDIDVGDNGSNGLTEPGAAQNAQRTMFRLYIFQGELFMAANKGMPYLQRIFGQNLPDTVLDQIIRDYVLEDPEILSVTEMNITRNKATRKASVKFSYTYLDGTLVTVVLPDGIDGQLDLDGAQIFLDGVPVYLPDGLTSSNVITLDGEPITLYGEIVTLD